MKCVFFIINMVVRPKMYVKIDFVGLTSIKCSQTTIPGVLIHLDVLWYGLPNVNFSIMHPCNTFGLWTVNKKSEEFVTLHSDFLEMSYKLNIKMKCLAPLHLGDVKNF